MSTRLLYKAFFGRRYAPIVGVTLAICGLYGGYLLWFICQRYLPGPDAAAWHLAFLIGWMLCSFLALGRIPDALFTNRRLCAVRWLPVPGTLLVRLTLGHLLLLQGGIIALVFWGFFLHAEGGRASLLRLMLACLLCAALADLGIYLLALLASRVLSARTLGYGFIVLQYGGFFLLALLSARTVLRLPDFSNLSCAAALKAFGALLLLCAALSHAATARWYERGVAKAQQFQRQHRLHTAAPSSIRHPYLLLEWKRVLRNKELVFYTTIKNLVTIALLVSLFHQRVQLLLPDATLLTLVLLSVSCAINTIASTAYSSDASRHCYDFLPIDGARLFLWKTLVAAFLGDAAGCPRLAGERVRGASCICGKFIAAALRAHKRPALCYARRLAGSAHAAQSAEHKRAFARQSQQSLRACRGADALDLAMSRRREPRADRGSHAQSRPCPFQRCAIFSQKGEPRMIEIHDLCKSYGETPLFSQLSLTLHDGHIIALVGRNGIGKTTLLKAITQPKAIDGGSIFIDGLDSRSFATRRHFFFVPDDPQMFPTLTGREYLQLIGGLYQQPLAPALDALCDAFALHAALSTFIGDCSLGMQQKLVLAAAFLSGANNFILDEPFNGLDPASAIALKNQLRAHRDAGGLILLSTHNLDFVSNFCDTILFIDRSHRLITQPNPHDLSALEAAFFRHASA